MSLNHFTSSANENKWMNISLKDLKAETIEVSGGTTFNGPFTINETNSSVINGNVSSGVPLLICNGTNTTNGNVQVGIKCANSAGDSINLSSVNRPIQQQSVVADNNLLLTSLGGTVSLYPGATQTLVTSPASTTISTPLTLPAQQYLEYSLTLPQLISNNTLTTINFDNKIRNVGDLGYLAGVVTVNTTGVYNISYQTVWQIFADATPRLGVISTSQGQYANLTVSNNPTANTTLSSSASIYLTAGSTFSIQVLQQVGGGIVVTSGRLSISRLG